MFKFKKIQVSFHSLVPSSKCYKFCVCKGLGWKEFMHRPVDNKNNGNRQK